MAGRAGRSRHRFALDYLDEEVLDRPADEVRAFPLPLVVHIVGATTFALVGILQFVPRFRRS